MRRSIRERVVVVSAVVAALLAAASGPTRGASVLPWSFGPSALAAGTIVCGVAAGIALVLAIGLRDRPTAVVAVSALALALSSVVPGVLVTVLVAVAQAALIAAGILVRGALGRTLTVLAGLWFLALLATSTVPFTDASQTVLVLWLALPGLLQGAAYLVATVLVARPFGSWLRRGTQYLRETAEVR